MKSLVLLIRCALVAGVIIAVSPIVVATTALAQISVTASIAPVHSIVTQITQGVGTVSLLIGRNQSAHYTSLKPSQARALETAQLVFWVGDRLESFMVKPLSVFGGDKRVVSLIDVAGLDLLQGANDKTDPHVWLSTRNARLIGRAVRDELIRADGENSDLYEENYVRFEDKLLGLERELTQLLAAAGNKKILIYHDALRYFARQFGVSVRAIPVGNEELTLSASRIASIANLARSGKFACIFIEPGSNAASIRAVADDVGIKLAYFDPLGSNIEPGVEQYFTMMRTLARAVADC